MVARRPRISSVGVNAVESIPSGANTSWAITSPSRFPVIPSTTWPHQSMLLPYSHRVPGSKSSGVLSAALDAVITLGCPCSVASRR